MNRKKFEAHCVKHIHEAMDEFDQHGRGPTVEDVCWKNEDGRYGAHVIQDAWLGYQWAMSDARLIPTTTANDLLAFAKLVLAGLEAGAIKANNLLLNDSNSASAKSVTLDCIARTLITGVKP